MTDIASPLDDLRISPSEVDVLATLTRAAYDDADWMEPDPAVIDAMATLLDLIEKSSFVAMAAHHRLHGAIADAQPAPAGERWDGEGTAPGRDAELLKRDADLVRRFRERLVAASTPRPTTRSSAGTGFPVKMPTRRCSASSSATRRC
jgi:hypothetical protein